MQTTPFAEAVEAADRLPAEDQLELIDILRRRLAEAGRRRLVAEVEEARCEFTAGGCHPATPDELMRDILS